MRCIAFTHGFLSGLSTGWRWVNKTNALNMLMIKRKASTILAPPVLGKDVMVMVLTIVFISLVFGQTDVIEQLI